MKNEFLMKSKLTFHEAALDQIKTNLIKYLAPIVFYLEQDGVISTLDSNENETLKVNSKILFSILFS